jgi:hypothetical protein
MNCVKIFIIIIYAGYVLPLSILVASSLAKDGFIETFKKLKNFNK